MPKKGKRKTGRPTFPVAAAAEEEDSDPTKLGTSTSSCPSGADESGKNKNSTSYLNIESLDWETCTKEDQLEIFIKKKLENFYAQALSTLVYKGFDEDVALNGLLVRGYCVGEGDCLSNVVQNSLEFLTGKDAESEEQDRPQPFRNLELLVDFNLHFMLYILQKYRPNLNRIYVCRCILMTDLNLNRSIIMNINETPFEVAEMPGDLNLDDEDGDKDGFLALEIREMLDNLNVLDDSVTEGMKDAMIAGLQKPIDDLKPVLEERIRWASKKVAQARRNQPFTITSLKEELQLLQYFTESFLAKRESELLSVNKELANAEESKKRVEMEKEELKAEISASKLIVSEARQKLLEVSKKGRKKKKKSEKQKEEELLQEEIELEKKKISKWEQQLVETEAAIFPAEEKLVDVTEARINALAQIYMECKLALDSWIVMSEAMKNRTNEEKDIIREPLDRLRDRLIDAITKVSRELQT